MKSSTYLPVGDDILVPSCPLDVAELVHVRDAAPGATHHRQGVPIQHPRHVEPKEHLHVFHLGGEGGRAALHAAHRFALQVVEPLEVFLREGSDLLPAQPASCRAEGFSPFNHPNFVASERGIRFTASNNISLQINLSHLYAAVIITHLPAEPSRDQNTLMTAGEKNEGAISQQGLCSTVPLSPHPHRTHNPTLRLNTSSQQRKKAGLGHQDKLTAASFKSACGSVDAAFSPSGANVGAAEHGPGTSKTRRQQGSSMTCIFTLRCLSCSGQVQACGAEVLDIWKPFKRLL